MVNTDPAYRGTVLLLEHKGRIYLLKKDIAAQLPPEEYFAATLYTAITRENEVFFWYVEEVPDATHDWFHSAGECVAEAMKGFIRVRTSKKAYKPERIRIALPPPKYPKETFKQLRKIAFKDYLIDSLDHFVLLYRQGLK